MSTNSKFKIEDSIYWVFLFFCFFPFLNIFRIPTDSQPNALLLSFIIVGINYKNLFNHFPKNVLLFIFLAIIAVIIFFLNDINIDSLISLTSYISLIFIPLAVFITLLKFNGLPFNFLKFIIIIWGIVAIIQKFIFPNFFQFLLYRSTGLGLMGRGVNSLAPEPTLYGSIMSLFVLVYFINNKIKKNRKIFYFILFQIIFLSASSTVFAVFLFSLLIYFTIDLIKLKLSKYFLKLIFILSLISILVYNLFFLQIEETRIFKIINIILNHPELIFIDESINERFNHAFFPLISLFENYGIPHGFNQFLKYIEYKSSIDPQSIYFQNINFEHYKKIMSAYGSVFFEMGLFGIILPYFLYINFKKFLNKPIYLFIFIVLNTFLFTSISLNNAMILFIFGNILYLNSNIKPVE